LATKLFCERTEATSALCVHFMQVFVQSKQNTDEQLLLGHRSLCNGSFHVAAMETPH